MHRAIQEKKPSVVASNKKVLMKLIILSGLFGSPSSFFYLDYKNIKK